MNNRTDLYPFRYNFNNINTSFTDFFIHNFENQDILVAGQMSKQKLRFKLPFSYNLLTITFAFLLS